MLLEIVSLEIPVIATNEGGNMELIEHGSDGLLVGYNDKKNWIGAIRKVTEDRHAAAMMAKNALRRLREHDSEANLHALVQVFNASLSTLKKKSQ